MMLARLRCLLVALMIVGGAAPIWAGGQQPQVRSDPNFPPLSGGPSLDSPGSMPERRSRGLDHRRQRPQIFCDGYGRCFERLPDRFGGHSRNFDDRPPGWADDMPGRIRYPDRFDRSRSGVVCDRATRICYRNGFVDKSETRDAFGNRAADYADDLRDDRGSGRIFVPERGITCDAGRQVCFDGRTPDASLTRRYFGGDAARRLF
jgi:hypothetical protein